MRAVWANTFVVSKDSESRCHNSGHPRKQSGHFIRPWHSKVSDFLPRFPGKQPSTYFSKTHMGLLKWMEGVPFQGWGLYASTLCFFHSQHMINSNMTNKLLFMQALTLIGCILELSPVRLPFSPDNFIIRILCKKNKINNVLLSTRNHLIH